MENLWIALTIALGLASGQPAAAQERKAAQPSPQAENSPARTTAAGEQKDRTGTKEAKIDRGDRRFLEKAAELGHAELSASKLAATKASRPEVRDFAKQMVEDHTKAHQELQALASRKGVTLPAGPDGGHEKDLKKLEDLSGARFDREYMAGAGIKDHDRSVDLFRDTQKDTKDPDIKAFIDKTLPVLQKHHQMAKTVHASVKDDRGSAVGAGKDQKKSETKKRAESKTPDK
jgi:putative membrane protein